MKTNTVDILVLNNFGFFPTQPPPSTSYVIGLLRSKGFLAKQIDIGIELWDYFLSPQYLKKMELKPDNLLHSSCQFCPPITEKRFKALKDYVVQAIDKAKMILRDGKQFYNIKKLAWATHVIFQAQQVIYYNYGTFMASKAIYWPYIGFNVNSLKAIYALSEDTKHNPFIEAIEREIIPRIKHLSPDLIGIDIIFPWEIVHVLTLNKLLKKHLPVAHINFIGHGFDEFSFARVKDRLKINTKLFLGFDSLFLVRNDESLCDLVSIKDRSFHNLQKISSLAYIDNNIVGINGLFEEGKINFNIFPDYSDLPLKKYFAPKLVFIDKMSTKCFWSQCTYCSINSYKKNRQEVDIDRFIDRLIYYKTQYSSDHIFLLDESATPGLAINFSEKLIERGLNIKWSLRTRIDKRFNFETLKKMHSAGCRELWIGLETVVPRLLKLMNKTENPSEYPEIAKSIMKDCNDIGIGLHFCLIFGFPSDEDREVVIDFFKNNIKSISKLPFFVTYNMFGLMPDSEIFKQPKNFKITEIIQDEDHFNMISIPYKSSSEDETNSIYIQSNIEKTAEVLTNLFVKNIFLKLLWYFSSDSSYEMLLKEHFCSGNPFQTNTTAIEKFFMSLSTKLENLPYISKAWRFSFDRWIVGIK
jgi:hypothetical protein